MLANMARRCSGLRLSFRWTLPWRMSDSRRRMTDDRSGTTSSVVRRLSSVLRSVMIFEPLGQLLDIVRRPARHFHAEMKPHLGQHFLDLVERLAAEIRRPQHFGFRLLNKVADIDDVVVLETIGRAHRKLELVHLLEEGRIEREVRNDLLHLLFARLLEIDEDVELILQ